MKKYLIDFKITVSTARVIAASSKTEAVGIARNLIRDDDYWEGIIESIEDDDLNWLQQDCKVYCLERAYDTDDADNE